MSESKPITTRWLMDKAAQVAYLIRIPGGRFDRGQLFRLVEVLEATTGDREALLCTALYALRQAKRREIPPRVAEALRDVLLAIIEAGGTKSDAREFLGYLRWFFDATERVRLPRASSLDEVNAEWLLKHIGQKVI